MYVSCSVLQCVAVCCSVLHHLCVAVGCSALQCVAVGCSVLQWVAVCCSALQCVAVCCSVLHYLCVAVCCSELYVILHVNFCKRALGLVALLSGFGKWPCVLCTTWVDSISKCLRSMKHRGYRVAKTQRMPYLYRSFFAKEPSYYWLFCGKWPATWGILWVFATL